MRIGEQLDQSQRAWKSDGIREKEGGSIRKKVEKIGMQGKQEENRACEEASGGTHATRKADRSSGEGKTSVTSAELQGLDQMLLFLKNVENKTIHEAF